METVTRLAERHPATVSMVSTPGPEVARTLSVTAIYLLSEDGRKASLLAGGDGRAVQQIAIQVPANRLGHQNYGGPFSLLELKVIQEVITLIVFVLFSLVFFKTETFRWNHLIGFVFLILAVYFIFKK